MNEMQDLIITSPSFRDGGIIPKKHTGFGEDISPAFELHNLSDDTISLAILMEDLDIPFVAEYPHWLIWNIPKMNQIPENIPYGATVSGFQDAVQGVGYGKNRYRGPKQPVFVRKLHRYRFTIYALDCKLELDSSSRKEEMVNAMNGHILQKGSILGSYQRKMK